MNPVSLAASLVDLVALQPHPNMVDGYAVFLASDLALKRYPSITVGSTISSNTCQAHVKVLAGRVASPPLVGGLEGHPVIFVFLLRGAFFLSACKAERLGVQLK